MKTDNCCKWYSFGSLWLISYWWNVKSILFSRSNVGLRDFDNTEISWCPIYIFLQKSISILSTLRPLKVVWSLRGIFKKKSLFGGHQKPENIRASQLLDSRCISRRKKTASRGLSSWPRCSHTMARPRSTFPQKQCSATCWSDPDLAAKGWRLSRRHYWFISGELLLYQRQYYMYVSLTSTD